jgi:hypothetical protein
VARLGERIKGYGRGQQHLWHLNPVLTPKNPCSPHRMLTTCWPTHPHSWPPRTRC